MILMTFLASIALADPPAQTPPPALPAANPMTPPPPVAHCKVWTEVETPGYSYRVCGNPVSPRGVLVDSTAGAIGRGGSYAGYRGAYTSPWMQGGDAAASQWGSGNTTNWGQTTSTNGSTSSDVAALRREVEALRGAVDVNGAMITGQPVTPAPSSTK